MNQDDVYLNGEWITRADAKISVFDRGFIFGDGIYELVQCYERVPFFADLHMRRLAKNLDAVGIPNPRTEQEWIELFNEAAKRSQHENTRIYLQVTRGVAPRRHCFPDEVKPTVFLFSDELILPDENALAKGLRGVTQEDFRWLRGDIKSISLMAAVLASEKAASADATETIFIRDGIVTEGASSNVLVVKDNKLLSPTVDLRILSGITLTVLDKVAKELFGVEYGDISEDTLRNADEVMICSSGKEIVPITLLDDKPVGNGKPGEVYKKLHSGLKDLIEKIKLDAAN